MRNINRLLPIILVAVSIIASTPFVLANDYNNDGEINLQDFLILNQWYGSTYSFSDLLMMGKMFGTSIQGPDCNNNGECEYSLGESFESCSSDCPFNIHTQRPYLLWNQSDIEAARAHKATNPFWQELSRRVNTNQLWWRKLNNHGEQFTLSWMNENSNWFVRLSNTQSTVTAGMYQDSEATQTGTHTVRIRVRGATGASARLQVVSRQTWAVALQEDITLSSNWQTHDYSFAFPTNTQNLRVIIMPGQLSNGYIGTVDVDETLLRRGSGNNLLSNSGFENSNIHDYVLKNELWDCNNIIKSIYGITTYYVMEEIPYERRVIDIRSIVDELLEIPTNYECSVDTHIRLKMLSLAILYDNFYEELGTQRREAMHQELVDMIEVIESGEIDGGSTGFLYSENGIRLLTHQDGARRQALAALLAFYGDCEASVGCTDYLRQLVSIYEEQSNPLMYWNVDQGGHFYGWAYTSYYTFLPFYMWEQANKDSSASWLHESLGNIGLYHIYGLQRRPMDTENIYAEYPSIGNFFKYYGRLRSIEITSEFPYYLRYYDNPYYVDYLMRFSAPNAYWYYNFEMLTPLAMFYHEYKDKQSQNIDELPLSRNFGNNGYVVMRDAWDFDSSTHLTFKSSKCFTGVHQHFDQNSFTLFYKSPLLTDSGEYDSYGTNHYHNYYRRTIAHNTLVVYDPEEDFSEYHNSLQSNDGGQIYIWSPATLARCTSLHNLISFRGIMRYEHSDDYTYTTGDASLAYTRTNPAKVPKFNRHVLFLPQTHYHTHPVIVMIDDIIARSHLNKTILYHTIEEPFIAGNMFTVPGNGSELRIVQHSQNGFVTQVIGGAGREYEVEGINYPAQDDGRAVGPEVGNWRIEVTDTAGMPSAKFMSVLLVGDEGQVFYPNVRESNGAVMVGDDVFLLLEIGSVSATFPTPIQRVFLIGNPNGRYNVDFVGLNQVHIAMSSSGNVVLSDQGIGIVNR